MTDVAVNPKPPQTLQARLAERLQAVESQGEDGPCWLAVRVGSQRCLIPLAQAGEIFPWGAVNAVPHTQPWFCGVANLRGDLIGVVDLAQWVGEPARRSEQMLAQCSIVTVHPGLGANAGIVVDQLLGLRGEKDLVRESAVTSESLYWGANYEGPDGTLWRELRIPELVQSPEFLQVRL